MEKILSVSGLQKSYVTKGNTYPVLKGISMEMNRGEFVAVMGPSGSGKTTLLNIVSGFLSADSGEAKVGLVDMLHTDKEKQAEIRSSILGFIFQDFMLIDGLTVQENIFLPQIIAKKSAADMEGKTKDLLCAFGIEDISGKYPSELSGGQKQRVAIARALSNEPLLILADEPTGNLDSKSSNAVIEAFLFAKKQLGATILMVTHDAFAASYADRVIALSDGMIVRELVRQKEQRQFMNDILEFLKIVELSEWHSLDMLLLGREHQYMDVSRNEWASEIVVNVSDFNGLSGMNLSVPDDGYIYFQDSDDSMFQTCSEDKGLFYNPGTKEDFTLQKIELLSKESVLNETAKINSFVVVSDNTFHRISDTLDSSYKMTYYLFHGSNPEKSNEFQEKLLAEIVELNNRKLFVNYQDQAVKEKQENHEDIYIPYDGNELYAARWWEFYPYAKQTELAVQMEAGAVYLILIFFIATISFVAATMIMGLKIAGTILQDAESYKRAMYLGLKENDLKKVIRKQIGLIYFFPVICGCITASFMINRFMEASSATHIFEITMVAIGLSLVVLLIQLIIFFFLQKKLVVSTSGIIYESR